MIDGQALPDSIAGYGKVRPYRDGAIPPAFIERTAVQVRTSGRETRKLLDSIEAVLDACAVQDGATLSFHHHLRNGDQVLNMVLDAAARRGLKDLRIAPSSLFAVHEPLIGHIRSGVVTHIVTSYMSGPVANAISQGVMTVPVVMQTHGGRARAIEAGELHIDVAFIAAPCADSRGNVNGVEGRAACGPLGYAMVDVQFADQVVAVTDHLAAFPICPIDIRQDQVDFVVTVESIGDPRGILSGTTRPTNDPIGSQLSGLRQQVLSHLDAGDVDQPAVQADRASSGQLSIGHRLHDSVCVVQLGFSRRKHCIRLLDLGRVNGPFAFVAQGGRSPGCRLKRGGIGEVAERSVDGAQTVSPARDQYARLRVLPQVQLVKVPFSTALAEHAVVRAAAPDDCRARLRARRIVAGSEAQRLEPPRTGGDRFHIGHA